MRGTTPRKPTETPPPPQQRPARRAPGWASITWWGELAPASLATVFVAEPHLSCPASRTTRWLHPRRSTRLGPGSQQLSRPSSRSRCSTLPPSQGAAKAQLGVGEAEGAEEEGREGGGRKPRFSFPRSSAGGETTTFPPSQLSSTPRFQQKVISHGARLSRACQSPG